MTGPADCSTGLHVPPEACDCCAGIEASTPVRIDNRLGLASIAYRIGEWPQFRSSLVAGLSSSRFAMLDALRTRENADFTIGFVDAIACAADVLTFYQERIANESYLRTATERVSLQEMAKLIGYRLKPGVAAETPLAFALEPPKAPPAGLPPDPGAFVTNVPARVTLAAGLQVQSIPGPDEKPQTFETIEAIDARPEWNAMRAVTRVESIAAEGATEVWLQGVDTRLAVGDWLVLVGAEFDADAGSEHWDARRVVAVQPDAAGERTRVAWASPLVNATASLAPPTVHALRQRASVFGHNAPSWSAMSAEFKLAYPGGHPDPGEWPDFEIHCEVPPLVFGTFALGPVASLLDPGRSMVSLDNSYPKIVAAGLALLVTPNLTELYRITGASEGSRARFAIAGKSTCITLAGDDLGRFSGQVRSLAIHAQSEVLRRGQAPKTTPVAGASIDVAGDVTELPVGRRLLVKGLRVDGGAPLVHPTTLLSATAAAGGNTVLGIDPPLPVALSRATVVVFGNVAPATHGETVTEVLGSGDASQAHQRFELKRLPLTYRSAINELGADSELGVRVGDVEWSERPTLFAAGPNDRVYTLRTDEAGRCWIVFGDGVRGRRLPSGTNNVRATYRQGVGRDGNLAPEQLAQPKTRPLGLKSVSNPLPSQGGTDPESADDARRSMPLGTRTLGRAVSLLDYEDFALAFTGIGKAQARVLQLGGGATIAVTVSGQDGAVLGAGNPVWEGLGGALKASGDPHVRIVLLPHRSSTFQVGLKVKRDPAYAIASVLAAVEAALREKYGFRARALGEPVQQSEVIATVHAVPGVVAVDLDLLYGGTAPWWQVVPSRQSRLLAQPMRAIGGVAQPAELLTLDQGPLARLEEMP